MQQRSKIARGLTLAAAATGLALAPASLAFAQSEENYDVSLGVLTCEAKNADSFIFGSTRQMSCVFERNNGEVEEYDGVIQSYGVDIGFTESSTLVWGVVAVTDQVPDGALAGSFAGVSAEATLGIGGGINLLVGGPDAESDSPNVALQPISVEGNQGLNIAAGVSELTLEPRVG